MEKVKPFSSIVNLEKRERERESVEEEKKKRNQKEKKNRLKKIIKPTRHMCGLYSPFQAPFRPKEADIQIFTKVADAEQTVSEVQIPNKVTDAD